MAKSLGSVPVQGFECDFVQNPPEAIQSECPFCLQILREPYQAPCCGNSLCRVCIERIKADNKPCPMCNEKNFSIFHNKGLQRSLYGFQVYCSHKQEGCEWKGELGQLDNHLNLSPQPDKQLKGCEFTEIQCIYCSELIKRGNFDVHQNKMHVASKSSFSCHSCKQLQEKVNKLESENKTLRASQIKLNDEVKTLKNQLQMANQTSRISKLSVSPVTSYGDTSAGCDHAGAIKSAVYKPPRPGHGVQSGMVAGMSSPKIQQQPAASGHEIQPRLNAYGQPVQSAMFGTCKFPGCPFPKRVEGGKVHDFCSRTCSQKYTAFV